ncbi:MAG: DMT family transporter [Deltaproteobacteria bacterium]|jgi:drug/metabolite transporter (DMT)-like permease|nr:DMT family transporter [Deltaproteobacteria bacterium]
MRLRPAAILSDLPPAVRGSALVFCGAAGISFGPLIIKSIQTGATSAAFYRMLFGGLALLLMALIRRERLLPPPHVLIATLLAGAAFSGDLFFWHRSIVLAGPGLSTLLANFQVFVLALAGVFFFGDRPSLRLFGSIALAFGGLMLLLEVDPRALPPDLSRGILYGLITSIFLSIYILSLRHSRSLPKPLPLIANMAWVSLAAAAVLGGLLMLEGGSFTLNSPREAWMLVLYGCGCQAAGWLMVSAGLPHISPGRGGLLLMAEPLCAFIWEALFLRRSPGPVGWIGAGLTLLAIYICLKEQGRGQNQDKNPSTYGL